MTLLLPPLRQLTPSIETSFNCNTAIASGPKLAKWCACSRFTVGDTDSAKGDKNMTRSNSKWALPLVIAVLTAAACGVRTTTTDVNPRMSRAPTCDEAIEIYKSRAEVPYDYYELTWINAEGNSVWTTDGQVVGQIKKKAAENGANAIIVNDFTQSAATTKVIGAALGGNTADVKTSALAIYMPGDANRVTLKCGK